MKKSSKNVWPQKKRKGIDTQTQSKAVQLETTFRRERQIPWTHDSDGPILNNLSSIFCKLLADTLDWTK